MAPTDVHVERIRDELLRAGVTAYGIIKFSSNYLPEIIHEDEHVIAAVYGRYREGRGLLSFSEGMLVATSLRIVFLDHKPGFTTVDEIGYDLIAGIKHSHAGPFASVTVHTWIGDFTIRFAKPSCAERFVHYVETRRLETPVDTSYSADQQSKEILRRKASYIGETYGPLGRRIRKF